jgi:hypothetical protein
VLTVVKVVKLVSTEVVRLVLVVVETPVVKLVSTDVVTFVVVAVETPIGGKYETEANTSDVARRTEITATAAMPEAPMAFIGYPYPREGRYTYAFSALFVPVTNLRHIYEIDSSYIGFIPVSLRWRDFLNS